MFLRLTDLPLAGKRVFIRADLNVPQDDAGNITEDTFAGERKVGQSKKAHSQHL